MLVHRILLGVIRHQARYLETADTADLALFTPAQLGKWLNEDSKYNICGTWISRLVNRLSVITPSGQERPLKWFFQNQKGINKRLIKQFLEKESEDLESGKLKKAYTDNELKGKLEAFFSTNYELRTKNYSFSRHSISNYRREMGIPSSKGRVLGYKYPPLFINFSGPYPLTAEHVAKYAPPKSGVYEFSVNKAPRNRVFYIGNTTNIKKRLKEHLRAKNRNGHIRDFLKKSGCVFRFVQLSEGYRKEEARFCDLFVATYGRLPDCNRIRPGRD